MEKANKYDVMIIGGGPAGSCAALRLVSLGHSVALIEQEGFPREQIGESLSPGIRNIFEYLKAGHLLEKSYYLQRLPATVIWENRESVSVSPQQRGPGIVVDRGQLDFDLLRLATERGLQLFQPARFESCCKMENGWLVKVRQHDIVNTIHTTFILDARGRRGLNAAYRILTSPPSVAIWTHTPAELMPQETCIEAVEQGWLWGSPLPGNRYRMMAFTAPSQLKNTNPAALLQRLLTKGQLFKETAGKATLAEIQTCSVFTGCNLQPWEDKYICLGESAFTLDPLSSSGVEKAMRFSLQAAIAVNTALRTGDETMCRTFYEDRLIESVAAHTAWTSRYYAQAWCGQEHMFWKERGEFCYSEIEEHTPFLRKLADKIREFSYAETERPLVGQDVQKNLVSLWHKRLRLSPDLVYLQVPCVVEDSLQLKTAVKHSGLKREIAYIEQVELSPLLTLAEKANTFGDLIYHWNSHLPFEQSARIAVGLWEMGILTVNENGEQ